MNIKRAQIYMMLGIGLLLSISGFISSGWADEQDVFSFVSREIVDGRHPIILMDTQGKILQKLVIPGPKHLSFSWAPDGDSFAYHAIHDEIFGLNFDIYVADVKTKTIRQVTLDGGQDIFPAWSPNGKWISFASNRTGNSELYRIDVDGGNLIQLTKGQDCDRSAWSPGSQWIAFTSRATLFVMDAEGGRLRQLAANLPLPDCAWSPDGKKIVFATNFGIFRIDADGKNRHQLTGLDQQEVLWDLAWSPSGKWIIYRFSGGSVLWILDTTGNEGGKPLEKTRGLVRGRLDWVPQGFLSVSPSAEKQTTLWGRLKQTSK